MTPQRKVSSKETTNPLQSQTADLQMKGRRRSAGQLLSIANNCDDWKKFYGCDEADSSSGLVRRSSLHNLMVPDKDSSLDKEKESWKNMYGHSPSSLYHSKSEDCVDLNVTQIINLKKLTSKPRKIKHKEPTKSKLILPSIHEKHNTVHVCRSPVILSRKSRFKQVQIRGSNPLFGESGKEHKFNRVGDFSPTIKW